MSIVNFLDKFRTDTSLKNMIFPLTSVEIIRNNRRIIFVDYNIKEGASTIVKSRFGSCAKSVNIESVGITATRKIWLLSFAARDTQKVSRANSSMMSNDFGRTL